MPGPRAIGHVRHLDRQLSARGIEPRIGLHQRPEGAEGRDPLATRPHEGIALVVEGRVREDHGPRSSALGQSLLQLQQRLQGAVAVDREVHDAPVRKQSLQLPCVHVGVVDSPAVTEGATEDPQLGRPSRNASLRRPRDPQRVLAVRDPEGRAVLEPDREAAREHPIAEHGIGLVQPAARLDPDPRRRRTPGLVAAKACDALRQAEHQQEHDQAVGRVDTRPTRRRRHRRTLRPGAGSPWACCRRSSAPRPASGSASLRPSAPARRRTRDRR